MAELRTRIQLKYDSFENWLKYQELIPLKGEVCIVNPSTGSNYNVDGATSCLMKVGDGVTPFKDLPWLSALAADVHSWAKYDAAKFTRWITNTPAEGESFVDSPKLATAADVSALSNTVAAHTTAIETLQTAVGSAAEGETPASGLFANIATLVGEIERIDSILGVTEDGNTENVLVRVEALETAFETQGNTLETLSGTVTSQGNLLTTLNGDAETEGSIKAQVKAEADRAKEAEGTLLTKINEEASARETAITNAKNELTNTINGVSSVASNNAAILETLLEDGDTDMSIRDIAANEINTIIGGVSDADTITSIHTLINYVNTNGSQTTQILSDVATNKSDIATLKTGVADNLAAIQGHSGEINAIKNTIGSVAEGSTIVAMITAAENASKEHTNTEVKKVSDSLTLVEQTVGEHTTAIAANLKAIEDEITRAKAAEKELADGLAEVVGNVTAQSNAIKSLTDNALTFIHGENDTVEFAEGGKAVRLVFNCGDSNLND